MQANDAGEKKTVVWVLCLPQTTTKLPWVYMGKTNESALFADLNNQNTKRKINKRLRKFVYIIFTAPLRGMI
jgi:hypothetical protein